MADRGVSVITTPPPTPTGPLHLGHLSGPYDAELVGFDPALAARSMLSLLASGSEAGPVLTSLTGIDTHAAASTRLEAA